MPLCYLGEHEGSNSTHKKTVTIFAIVFLWSYADFAYYFEGQFAIKPLGFEGVAQCVMPIARFQENDRHGIFIVGI